MQQNKALEKQLVGRDGLFLGSSLGPSSSLLSFVGSSDHLLSLELRQWVRTSC